MKPFAVLSAAFASVALCGALTQASASNPFDSRAKVLSIGDRVPSAEFIDQMGARVRLSDFRGQTVVLGFIYTACTDECPLISADFRQLGQLLAGGPFHLVELSIDPRRDTPAAIRRYAARFGAAPARWSFLTGNRAQVSALLHTFGVSTVDNGAGEILHNNRTFIIDPAGGVADIIESARWAPQDMAAQARHVARLSTDPLARLDLALSRAVAAVCGGAVGGRSGLMDLFVVLAVFAASAFGLYWLRRRLFVMQS